MNGEGNPQFRFGAVEETSVAAGLVVNIKPCCSESPQTVPGLNNRESWSHEKGNSI